MKNKKYQGKNPKLFIGDQEIIGFVTNEPIVIERRRTIWQEIQEAFPFWWCKVIGGIIHTPQMMANRELHISLKFTLPGRVRNIPIEINFDAKGE